MTVFYLWTNPPGEMIGEKTMIYPDNSLQKYIDDSTWWEKVEDKELRPGRLLWAFVAHVDVIPKSLVPTGRPEDDPTDHNKARYRITDLRIKAPIKKIPCRQPFCHYTEMNVISFKDPKKGRYYFWEMVGRRYPKTCAQA
jgi:hypothetical protein